MLHSLHLPPVAGLLPWPPAPPGPFKNWCEVVPLITAVQLTVPVGNLSSSSSHACSAGRIILYIVRRFEELRRLNPQSHSTDFNHRFKVQMV
jgi:hypothetical protein